MIGELVDSVVSVFSPASAARRAHARTVYRSISGAGYDSGRRTRSSDRWMPSNRAPDLEMADTADQTRARARALVRNNAYARGILDAKVRNVVGRGIKPQSRLDDNEEFNEASERLFNRWAKTCDLAGRLTFWEMQRQVVREVDEAGEVFIQFVSDPDDRSRQIPLALNLIDCDRLVSDTLFPRGINRETGNEVRRGVEVDATGRAVAYHFYVTHPNDLNKTNWDSVRVPADEVLHLFRPERIGQTRGVSAFAPVVWWLRNLGFYVENEVTASAVASCFTVAIKTIDGGASGTLTDAVDSSNTDAAGNKFEYLQPGMIPRLLPGEDIAVINPTRNSVQAGEWIQLMLRSMAVGTGLSYERLSRDYSRTNYSSNRASDLEDRRQFRVDQDWLISHFCEPVWNRVVAQAVMASIEGFPSAEEFVANYDEWTAHAWIAPGWEWVDPAKETTAKSQAIAAGLTTRTDELAADGKDIRDVLQTRAKEEQLIKQWGVELGVPIAQASTTSTEKGAADGSQDAQN